MDFNEGVHDVWEGVYKVVVLPASYIPRGVKIGAHRGLQGHNTPLGYEELARNYPNRGEIIGNSHKEYRFINDYWAEIGSSISMSFGTFSSTGPWIVTRLFRMLKH